MPDQVKIVKEYYDKSVAVEWERLQQHQFEFELTIRYINRYVKPGDKVLDIGGGPGRYSLYLAAKGCDVTLFDLSSANVEFAKEQAAVQGVSFKAFVGDAREVDSVINEQYDHILLMGPMYHLLEEADRVKAINASLKCLKQDGIIFVSFISSYGGIIYSMKYEPQLILEKDSEFHYKLFEDDLPFSGDSFTQSYFYRHKDILPLMARFPLEKLHFFGQESILGPCEESIKAQSQEVIDKWLDLAERVCEREDLLSFSEHLMYIGRKK
jgi:S-adenosylmethionine-dependent methyltransferase